MIKVRFIKDGSEGKTNKWRYKKNEEVLLPDFLALEAINEDLAIRIDRPRHEDAINTKAIDSLNEASKDT